MEFLSSEARANAFSSEEMLLVAAETSREACKCTWKELPSGFFIRNFERNFKIQKFKLLKAK